MEVGIIYNLKEGNYIMARKKKFIFDKYVGFYQTKIDDAESSTVTADVDSMTLNILDFTVNGEATVNSTSNLKAVTEAFTELDDATGVVEHDCSNGHVFYHNSPDANWTANLTNLDLPPGRGTSITLVVSQGGTARIPTALQVDGAAQTINWQANTVPTGTANRHDIVSFSILNDGGTYRVFGQLVSF